MPSHQIDQFICRADNFGVLLHNSDTADTIAIDAPDATAIEGRLAALGWSLTHILVTHHHGDHVDAIPALVKKWGCEVVGPQSEASKIGSLNTQIIDGQTFTLAGFHIDAIATPGHTAGPLSYHIPAIGIAFTGDTLFALGCGRLFEGSPADMWQSLKKLKALPAETMIYCGHEYTLANAKYALSVDPDNSQLQARVQAFEKLRRADLPTLPVQLADELATNPFLRADDPALKSTLAMAGSADVDVFAALRAGKDRF
jgi:hydroxyacylglutathione hydrolase